MTEPVKIEPMLNAPTSGAPIPPPRPGEGVTPDNQRTEPTVQAPMPQAAPQAQAQQTPAPSAAAPRMPEPAASAQEAPRLDQLSRIEDKAARIEEKYARTEALMHHVETIMRDASSRSEGLAKQADLAALREQVRAVNIRVDRLPGGATLFFFMVASAVIGALLTVLIQRYGLSGILPQ